MEIIRKLISWGAVAALALGCGGAIDGGDDDEGVTIREARQPLTGTLAYRGVNLCGAEFGVDAWGVGALPGTFGSSYTYPHPTYASGYTSADYFVGKGVTTFRLPFRWERLEPRRGQAFDATELTRLKTTVRALLDKGAAVLLDPQNFARYGTSVIGSSEVPNEHFADFWGRLAIEFKANTNVLFGLINEPHDLPTEQWVRAANAAIAAIRAQGATNLILVPGNGWTGAHAWTSSYYGTPNATALLSIVDPKNNYAFEVHQYLDTDSGGESPSCVSATIGSERMAAFTRWLRANGKRGFLGEFGGGANTTCLAAIDDMLKHVEANADVYLGWTYWAGGPWWGTYALSLEPRSGTDAAQMKALLPHLSWSRSTTSTPAPAPAPSPTPTTCQPTTYEAESMTSTTGGATTGGWNLWADGSLSTTHAFGSGRTSITVAASGQPAAGVWPRMIVSVGGAVVGTVNVTSTSYAPYTFSFDATAGTKTVTVAFDNDAYANGEDRNLLVDKITVGCPATTTCTAKTYEAETMTHSSGGATTGGWNLWSDGDASKSATFPSGTVAITVRAAGTPAAGVWPHFVLTVDGQTVGSGYASSTSWQDQRFSYSSTGGTKLVRVTFDNDAYLNGEDRNLLLDRVVVGCP